MKRLFFATAAVLVFGCGSMGSNSGQPPEEADGEKAPPPAAKTPAKQVAPAQDNGPKKMGIIGLWENSSCGERKYKRTINFTQNGQFIAVDEVAPCPPDKRCVWSGIIHWRGSWTLSDRSIALVPTSSGTEKLPETVPNEFVVLSEDPLSIGERSGDVVCPYQKK
jgi:hypothetical protein